jgi:curved DNA-binding protein CbpA
MSLDDRQLQQLLADLARGDKSQHAQALREAAEERGVKVDEIARRAHFMLACLLLPASGTFYEVLGVAPGASAAEIREHWTAAIHRYHPDHFGGRSPWLDAQARRLIEAYETLRNHERRRRYDAELARRGPRLHPPMVTGGEEGGPSRWRRLGWRLGILLLAVVAAGLWVWMRLAPGMVALPPAPVPPSPRLLETWRARFLVPAPVETGRTDTPHEGQIHASGGASRAPAAKAARAPDGESNTNVTATPPSAGPADSDRNGRAARSSVREVSRASSDGSPTEVEPARPPGAVRPPETSGTDH